MSVSDGSYGYDYEDEEEEEDDDDDDENEKEGNSSTPPVQPFIVSASSQKKLDTLGSEASVSWIRTPLFDGSRGELGLAWSIFRVKGTPTEENWPVSFICLREVR
jgi:hypothetical protein